MSRGLKEKLLVVLSVDISQQQSELGEKAKGHERAIDKDLVTARLEISRRMINSSPVLEARR